MSPKPTTIVPAILGARLADIRAKYERVKSLVDWVQVDVADGLFAQPATWPYKHAEDPASLHELLERPAPHAKVELHLMVENPETGIERWVTSGAKRLLFHYEATPHINELFGRCHEIGVSRKERDHSHSAHPLVELGVALKLETPVKVLESLVQPLAFVQLMAIPRIGAYGAPFSETIYPKIEAVRRKYARATISIDGGVSLENAPRLIAAGANQLVVGSALWRTANVEEAIYKFKKL
ncbi:MAG: hypothetical protein COV10_04165 [Candidatus Vogelbacteria bacterium CG10_big_fil_rev_8_21_14_0_10_51_16]|uniref:Ribulose-phosphate 3-epimerase n=1 Tax=Candidatus Vogelbacteria bacterium CG10_big_fil_rev_8_21_14_0_10_51_16 TaxID=1975045 RepID=A0A2H0RFF6_9BACT|nr:MAG: hypothetical protein COV10_04165 [Candidatus Vogelbacteria bacterium CG10_big_fil_rev_8_21_14_0_10_51_16]